MGGEPADRAEQDAQSGGVDEVHAAEVEQYAAATAALGAQQCAVDLAGAGEIDLAMDDDDLSVAVMLAHDGERAALLGLGHCSEDYRGYTRATVDRAIAEAVHDPRRLAAVRRSALLDTPAEEPFDRLAALAATLLEAPFAFVTVVDGARSFWKSAVGVEPGVRQNPVEESFCQYVVGSGRELVVSDAANDPRTRANPSVRAMGVAAWAGFPLRAPGGEVLGSFCVVDSALRDWTARDIDVLRTLASAAASEIALRASVRDEREARERAEQAGAVNARLLATLQETLLPPHLPLVPGIDLAAHYAVAGTGVELSGDFYDVFPSSERRWSAVMGDVCGKGVAAAKLAALARFTIRAGAIQSESSSEVLARLNRVLCLQRPERDTYLTALFAHLVLRDGRMLVNLCRAGHPPPLIWRAAGGPLEEAGGPGSLLGIFEQVQLSEHTLTLTPADLLVLVTDGVLDARGPNERFGAERLRAVVSCHGPGGAHAVADAIEAAVRAFSDGPLADDAAVLVLGPRGRTPHAAVL